MTNRVPILHTQLGFRPGQTGKRIVLPDTQGLTPADGSTCLRLVDLKETAALSRHESPELPGILRPPLQRLDSDFGSWFVADISSLRAEGVYQAGLDAARGPAFAVRDDLYLRLLPQCIRYLQIQSCGREVPGWHPECHLDGGCHGEEKRSLQAAGGWHDGAGWRKSVSSTSMMAISLLIAHRLSSGQEESLGLAPGIFLQEAMQGFDFFLNIQQADGSLVETLGVDNASENGDERQRSSDAAKCATLFALYAEELWAPAPEEAQEAFEAAERALEYERTKDERSMENLQWRAWAYLILYRIAGDDPLKKQALTAIRKLLDLQVTDYVGGQDITRGFWRQHADRPGFYSNPMGSCHCLWIMAEFIETFSEHAELDRWRDAIALWVDDFALVFAERNPFGLLPCALYDSPAAAPGGDSYRPLGDRLFFRYFLPDNELNSNPHCASAALAFAATARVLNRPALLDRGYRLLEWILGANPFQLCMMSGAGLVEPDPLSPHMGRIPGGVTLGPGGSGEDMPFYPSADRCSDEYSGHASGQFLWAALALQGQKWS